MATLNDAMKKAYNAWPALDSSFFCGLSTIIPAWAAGLRLLAKKSSRRTPLKHIKKPWEAQDRCIQFLEAGAYLQLTKKLLIYSIHHSVKTT